MKVTTLISTAKDKFNRLVATIRGDGIISNGSGDVRTAIQAGSFGFESNPTKNKVALYAKTGKDGKYYIVGYLNIGCKTEVGESRMFSTDEDGNEQISLHLKNDGIAEFGGNEDNMTRFGPAKDGFEQLRSDLNDLITKYNAHVHGTTTPGAPTAIPTGAPVGPSTASIDDAKIDEIKTSAP